MIRLRYVTLRYDITRNYVTLRYVTVKSADYDRNPQLWPKDTLALHFLARFHRASLGVQTCRFDSLHPAGFVDLIHPGRTL